MKITENVNVYKCDYCNRKMFVKPAMGKHESRCMSNPINKRPCLEGCLNLEVVKISYDDGDDYYGEPLQRDSKAFYCKLKERLMCHPKVEYFNRKEILSYVWLNDVETEQSCMPQECKEYSDNIF